MFERLKPYSILALLAGISVGGYLIFSYLYYRVGFPLDDAWIHQTYARNLVAYGEWAFQPGIPSAGSTSPLWSGILSLGYISGLAPYAWTFVLGWIFLFGVSLLGFLTFEHIHPDMQNRAIWVGVFLVFEWHLVWAAASGMETLPFTFLTLLVLMLLFRKFTNWLVLGLLIGLSVWLRPDGITLAAPAVCCAVLLQRTCRERWLALGKLVLGILILFLLYLTFNYFLSGNYWPNTFFAKQAEYAILRETPFAKRWLTLSGLPLVGAGVLLIPGFLWFTWNSFRARAWEVLLSVIWVLGYISLYAWRLPVTYQHGRYVIPAMAVFFLCSLCGMLHVLQFSSPIIWKRVLMKAYSLSLGIILAVFWLIGARAYSRDVAIIESEMVAAAHWIASNTEGNELIAAHDIGALGYFSGRRLLDLAGLTTPEVIPFIRDETRLGRLLDEKNVRYLVTFPSWYPVLVGKGKFIYSTQGSFSPAMGGENMCVYQWKARK